jgi:hypothetical protein
VTFFEAAVLLVPYRRHEARLLGVYAHYASLSRLGINTGWQFWWIGAVALRVGGA